MAKSSSKKSRSARPTLPQSVEVGKITVKEAHALWREVFGAATNTRNLPYLRRRLAVRMKELAQEANAPSAEQDVVEVRAGVVSERSEPRKRQQGLTGQKRRERDPRLPGAGATLEREYKGKLYKVAVGEENFEYAGKQFGSLSTIAKEITGQVWNGFVFFRSALIEGGGASEKGAA